MKIKKKLPGSPIARRVNHSVTGLSLIFLLFMISQGCQKNDLKTAATSTSTTDETSADLKVMSNNFTQVNLVADIGALNAQTTDDELVNAWGLTISDEGEIWVSSNEESLAKIYDASGQETDPPVEIPGGAPTGAIYNFTSTFIIGSTNVKSEFIYATEAGLIVAASPGNPAVTVADRSAFDAVYKGLAIAKNGAHYYLYATNFKVGKVDVFDENFNYVSNINLSDPTIPSGFAPFNVQMIAGELFVTYAKQLAPDNEDDEAGPGNGFVNIFNPNGNLIKRFASQGVLNSPWGVARVPGGTAILIGNFGDGRINFFTNNGTFASALKNSNGDPIVIGGLWGILFPKDNLEGSAGNRLYFTAGPDDESHGLFGFLAGQ